MPGPALLKVVATPVDASVMVMVHHEVDGWRRQALCACHPDKGAWFAEDGATARRAKAVCRACPVQAECLRYALSCGPLDGIWGGTTPYERRRLRRQGSVSS